LSANTVFVMPTSISKCQQQLLKNAIFSVNMITVTETTVLLFLVLNSLF